jgi:hypothetical protein
MGDLEEGQASIPRRGGPGPAWSLFLRSRAEAILACDFFTADLLDGTQAYVLAVIEHASRRIRILGVTSHPTGGMDILSDGEHLCGAAHFPCVAAGCSGGWL